MKLPQIEDRNVLKEMKMLAKQYIPEWNYDEDDPDFGVAFCNALEEMFNDTIRCFNRTPYNYYIRFLNLLGAKLAPSSSATGMISVTPTSGSNGVYIDKETYVYASANTDTGKVLFETEDGMYAADTSIDTIFFSDGETDKVAKIYDKNENVEMEQFRIFYDYPEKNIQKHEIYFSNDIILLIKGKSVVNILLKDIKSENNNKELLKIFSDKENIQWQYFKDDSWKDIEQFSLDNDKIVLNFNDSCDLCTIMDKESRFIRCVLKKIPEKHIELTNVMMESYANDLLPDTLLLNNTELTLEDCFPFGDELYPYTDFYIASEEAFSKKGAVIDIKVEMQFLNVVISQDNNERKIKYRSIMHKSDFEEPKKTDVKITRVLWEYWNGFGWARLYEDDTNEDFFNVKDEKITNKILSFKCPDDMISLQLGSKKSYFIRCRLAKVKNLYTATGNYITPYIHSVKIDYNYKGNYINCDEIITYSDLVYKNINLMQNEKNLIMKNTLNKYPTIYFKLSKPFENGPIKILFDIEDSTSSNLPSVQWEYYALDDKGEAGWHYINILDDTKNFEHSAIVTFMGKRDFSKTKIFGEEGYFIRLVNNDLKYRDKKENKIYPLIKGIHLNTISVVQKHTYPAEYFKVKRIDENKVCNLSNGNLIEVRVWVNELGNLSKKEEDYFIENCDNDKIQIDCDDKGIYKAMWIEWKEVHSISTAKTDERVFEVNYSEGSILFGNGIHGKIPPYQERSGIKVEYSVSEGSIGNIEANKIQGFFTSVPFISKVTNLKGMSGGMDKEIISETADRVATEISGMNRIVSMYDFENAICKNNRSVYKVKCVPHVDSFGNPKSGVISIALLPRKYMQGYEEFMLLKKNILDFVRNRIPVTMLNSSKLQILEAVYVEMMVKLDVVVDDYNFCQSVQQQIESKIENFLNPITGNFDGKGWEIGRIATKEQIYNCIKSVSHIKWIKSTAIFTKIVTNKGKKEVDYDYVKNNLFVVPISGGVDVNISVDSQIER